jgi:hypothetical protein
MESVKRKRRGFQFRLRTLMIGVTLLAIPCAYVGWQAKIVGERKAWLNAHPQRYLAGSPSEIVVYGDHNQRPSRVRLRLGDQTATRINISRSWSVMEIASLASLFPEADIIELAEFPQPSN